MAIIIACKCGFRMQIAPAQAGGAVRCPACGASVLAPAMGLAAGHAAPAPTPRSSWPWLAAGAGVALAAVIALSILVIASRGGPKKTRLATGNDPALAWGDDLADEPSPAVPNANVPARLPATVEPPKDATPREPLPPPKLEPSPKPLLVPPPLPTPDPQPRPVKPATPVKPAKQASPVKRIGQPLQLEWKLRPGDRFFQELRVLQKPVYNIQGILFNTALEYAIVSSFKVEKADASGCAIEQKVEAAQLVQADPLTQPLLAPALTKLPGTTFRIRLDDKMDIKEFAAADLPGPAMAQGAMGLQMASLLDRDGWKEMARTTFFQPNQPLKTGEKWSRPMTHAWGALGSWSGRVNYAYQGSKGTLHQFAFGLDIAYQPPKGKGGGLLAVSNAAFKAQQAGGVIVFDAARGKVVEARERFLVRGRLALQLLGQNTPIDLAEDQHFHLRITESDPRKK